MPRKSPKPKGPKHFHKWFLEKYDSKTGLYYYKCFCGKTITTPEPI